MSGEVKIDIRQADCDKGYQQRQVKFHQGSRRVCKVAFKSFPMSDELARRAGSETVVSNDIFGDGKISREIVRRFSKRRCERYRRTNTRRKNPRFHYFFTHPEAFDRRIAERMKYGTLIAQEGFMRSTSMCRSLTKFHLGSGLHP